MLYRTAAAAVLLAAAVPAAAQSHSFDIPAGPLGRSILLLGRQAGISIALADPSLAGVRVPAVRGRMTVQQALARMLAGTRARAVAVGPSSYRVILRAPRRSPQAPAPRPVQAIAQPPPVPQAEEDIVITASKRRTALSGFPGAAEVVQLSDLPVSSPSAGTEALTRHVAVLGSTHLGPGRDKLFIRAIADSSFSGQTQATVGQYLGEARLNYSAPDPSLRLYDVRSVEVLPGPQGTLYGAGTLGGVLRVVPNSPDPTGFAGSLTLSGAATAHGSPSSELAAILNLPLRKDTAAARMVGYVVSEGGYIDDTGRGREDVNRTTIFGGRAALALALTPNVDVELSGVAQLIDARDSHYAEKSEGRLERSSALAEPFRNRFLLGNLLVQGTFGAYRLVATGSVARHGLTEDFDATQPGEAPALFRRRDRSDLLVAEARLSRDEANGRSWLAGVSLVHSDRRVDRSSGAPGGLIGLPIIRNLIDEQTLFGEATQPLAPGIKLTAGARLSHVRTDGRLERVVHPEPGPDQRSTTRNWQFLPSLAVSGELGGGAIAYARYQEGFRPGGVILIAGQAQRLKSDHVAAWETGVRFGNAVERVSGALAASHTRWSDVQADLIDSTGFPTTTNLGDGRIWTLDGRLEARLMTNLRVNLAAVANRSRVTNTAPGIIFIDGAPLPNVPDYAARIALDYARPLGGAKVLRLLGWARYAGKSQLGIGPDLGRDQGDYLDTGVEAQIAFGGFKAFATATNLFDSAGNRFALGSIGTFPLEEQTTPMRPLTLRLGFVSAF